ncbi:MAG: methyltransferase domain-containing protein [Leptolyngbya sp. SIO4C1]|nr:methyltransferase domain-containing protein [Leptolyngbya sp. SIO4C1]
MNWTTRLRQLAVCAAIALLSVGCTTLPAAQPDSPYSYKSPSADGIGKVYLGREIAQVMGHQGAYWLERPSRELEERPDMAIDALDLQPTDAIADIGAGTGYMSFRLARQVPQGNVIAVDVQPEMIALLEAARDEQQMTNVETVLGAEDDPHLSPETLDLVLMVDAYHEFAYPREMAAALAAALKPGGRLVLAEYRAENPLIMIKRLHKMSQKQVKREMAAVGLRWLKTDERLPQQHLLFFEKPAG